jgi:hypothetical protein
VEAGEAGMGAVTLTPTPTHAFIARTAQSPAQLPPLPAKHQSVPTGEGSSTRGDGLSRDGGGQGNERMQVSGSTRATKHGPVAPKGPGRAFGRPHQGNQSPSYYIC